MHPQADALRAAVVAASLLNAMNKLRSCSLVSLCQSELGEFASGTCKRCGEARNFEGVVVNRSPKNKSQKMSSPTIPKILFIGNSLTYFNNGLWTHLKVAFQLPCNVLFMMKLALF